MLAGLTNKVAGIEADLLEIRKQTQENTKQNAATEVKLKSLALQVMDLENRGGFRSQWAHRI